MDNPPRSTNNDLQRIIQKESTYDYPNVGDIFSATRIRCLIRSNHALDGVILGNGHNFLLYFSIFLWALFLLI